MPRLTPADWMEHLRDFSAGQLRTWAPPMGVAEFRSESGAKLPVDLEQLYRATDGVWLGDEQIICPLGDLQEFGMQPGLFAIHEWGNGDATCVIREEDGAGRVVFCDHAPDRVHTVCRGVFPWLACLVLEHRVRGSIWHPMDYGEVHASRYLGVYAGIRLHDD